MRFQTGIATSIAAKQSYSWQFTIDYCIQHNLQAVQLYLREDLKTPDINSSLNSLQLKYLHLPVVSADIHDKNIPEYVVICQHYGINNLVLHETPADLNGLYQVASELNSKGFNVCTENDGNSRLDGFSDTVRNFFDKGLIVKPVIDVHRLFSDFSDKHSAEEIMQKIKLLEKFCSSRDIPVIFHIIDSKSFDKSRKSWCNLFSGIIPYKKLFDFNFENNIFIESVIFEYESVAHVASSITGLIDYMDRWEQC